MTIDAPVEIVFECANDPNQLVELWPSMTGVKNIRQLPDGGTRSQWTYNMAGIEFQGTSEDLEYIVNRHVVNKTEGGIESTMRWEFQSVEGGAKTKIDLEAEYTVPVPLVGRLAEAIIVSMNKQEFAAMLTYLKARTERLAMKARRNK
jgi:uncharacterized membrane protein